MRVYFLEQKQQQSLLVDCHHTVIDMLTQKVKIHRQLSNHSSSKPTKSYLDIRVYDISASYNIRNEDRETLRYYYMMPLMAKPWTNQSCCQANSGRTRENHSHSSSIMKTAFLFDNP